RSLTPARSRAMEGPNEEYRLPVDQARQIAAAENRKGPSRARGTRTAVGRHLRRLKSCCRCPRWAGQGARTSRTILSTPRTIMMRNGQIWAWLVQRKASELTV